MENCIAIVGGMRKPLDMLKGHPSGMSRLALGKEIRENPYLTIEGETIFVRRSWRERLFSLPWHPLDATKKEIERIPDPDVYLIRDRNMIMAHPETAVLLRQEIEQRKDELAAARSLGAASEEEMLKAAKITAELDTAEGLGDLSKNKEKQMAIDKWFNVNEDARVWAGHSDGHHKQGWIYAPAGIRAIEEYQGSYRFEEWAVDLDGRVDIEQTAQDEIDYPHFWIRIADVTTAPYVPDPVNGAPDPEPEPTEPEPEPVAGDAELGAAFRLVVNFLLGR